MVGVTIAGDLHGLGNCQNRKLFYANGLWWVFYAAVGGQKYRWSDDGGATWSGAIVFPGWACAHCTNVWFDGTYMYYMAAFGAAITFRRGVPESDGTITWSAAEQTALAAGTNYSPQPVVDSSGYPWGWAHQSGWSGVIPKSDTNDGTWSMEAGFPAYYPPVSAGFKKGVLSPFSGLKMMVTYQNATPSQIKARLYDAGWGGEENASTSNAQYATTSVCSDRVNDIVHAAFAVAYGAGLRKMMYIKRVAGVWSGEETVALGEPNDVMVAAIALDLTGRPVISTLWGMNELRVFRRDAAGVWDQTIYTLDVNGRGDDEFCNFICEERPGSGGLGILYQEKAASPYDLKFLLQEPLPSGAPGGSNVQAKMMELLLQ